MQNIRFETFVFHLLRNCIGNLGFPPFKKLYGATLRPFLLFFFLFFLITYNHLHDSGADNRTDKIPNKVLPHIIILQPYRTVSYWLACAIGKKFTDFPVCSRIKIKSSSQVNFFLYYGIINHQHSLDFKILKWF